LSSGRFVESWIAGKIVSSVIDSITQRGIPINQLQNFDLRYHAEVWGAKLLKENSDSLAGLSLTLLDVLSRVDVQHKKLLKGAIVSNSPDPISNSRRSGDPILLYRGEFERQISDLQVKGSGMDLEFVRTYRSGTGYFGPLGLNWDHSYNLRLRQDDEFTVVRLTGQLSEERFVQHPRFGESEEFNYYVPPDGGNDVVVKDNNDSFIIRRTQGITYHYELTDQPFEHRIKRIVDRFGNYLQFAYDNNGQLRRIFVNSSARYLLLSYNLKGFISRIEDHARRTVVYNYNDFDLLESVSGPTFPQEKPSRFERYEYDKVGMTHKLARVFNEKNQLVVENEYDVNELSDYFGYIIRQTENRGERLLYYENINQLDPNIHPRDLPDLRVTEYRRNGHQIEHILNEFGNELITREHIVDNCYARDIVTFYRYNSDGRIIAKMSPDGVLTQSLFERDHFRDLSPWPDISPTLGDISMKERMNFGNLLATVTRGRRKGLSATSIGSDFLRLIPPIKVLDHSQDVVVKYNYDKDSQLLVSKSDPRHTISADPLHVESAGPGHPNFNPADQRYITHQKYLTVSEYGPAPRFELRRTVFPIRTYPSIINGINAEMSNSENFIKYDAAGRLIEKKDARGYIWYNEYYTSNSVGPNVNPIPSAKEGFLRRQLLPHIDWVINADTLPILEVQTYGSWRRSDTCFLSSGTVGDSLKIVLEGAQITLFQSKAMQESISTNQNVLVSVDNIPLPVWNQTSDPFYSITSLGAGMHIVELSTNMASPIALGRVRSHVSLDYEVDDLGNVVKIIDPRGNTTVNVFDILGAVKKTTSGSPTNPSVIHYEYDSAGRKILERAEWRNEIGQTIPENSVIRRFIYNSSASLLVDSKGPERMGELRTIHHKFDPEENLVETTDPRGNRTRFYIDEINRPVRTVRAVCTPNESVFSRRYDLGDNVLEELNPRGASKLYGYLDAAGMVKSGRNTLGRVNVETDALRNLLLTDYDALGNKTTIRAYQRRPDNNLELLSRQAIEYDEHGDAVSTTTAIFNVPILTYDAIGNPDSEFLAASARGEVKNSTVELFRDAHGNQFVTRNPDGGNIIRYYDAQGRIFDEMDGEGRRIFRIFDGCGNVIRAYKFEPVRDKNTGNIQYNEVFVEIYKYDESNRLVERIDPFGNSSKNQYDTLGNRTISLDPLGNKIKLEYNAFRERTKKIEERTIDGLASGTPISPLITVYSYDATGNVINIRDPAQRDTQFEYDELNRQRRILFKVSPNEPAQIMSYDPAGNMTSLTDRNGLVRTIVYDLLDRVIRMDINTTNMPLQNALSAYTAKFLLFRYDAAGRLVYHENDFCSTEIKLDSRGLPIYEKIYFNNIPFSPGPVEISREFDTSGYLAKLVYPSRREVIYRYNKSGQLMSIENIISPADYPGRISNANDFKLADYAYVGNRLVKVDMGNKLTLTIHYDGRGLLLDQILTKSTGSIVWRCQRLKDANGLTRLESYTTRSTAISRKYVYDSTYQLNFYDDRSVNWIDTTALAPARSAVDPAIIHRQSQINSLIGFLGSPLNEHVFEYDIMGNRLMSSEPAMRSSSSVPNALNQYDIVDNNQWLYDQNGNLRSDGTRIFLYDFDNSLQEVTDLSTNTNQVTYYRNALGQVIAEKLPTNITFLINGGRRVLVELTQNGRTEHTYNPTNLSIVHSAKGGEDYWTTSDEIGSMRVLTDSLENLKSIPTYRPFGDPELLEINQSPFRFGFGNMWFTQGVPFLHTENRSYRTDLGRFLQRDPTGILQGANLYRYVKNSPLDLVDPTGLVEEGSVQRFHLETDWRERLAESYNNLVQDLRDPTILPEHPTFFGTVWDVISGHTSFDYLKSTWQRSVLDYGISDAGALGWGWDLLSGLVYGVNNSAWDYSSFSVGSLIHSIDPKGQYANELMEAERQVQASGGLPLIQSAAGLALSATRAAVQLAKSAPTLLKLTLKTGKLVGKEAWFGGIGWKFNMIPSTTQYAMGPAGKRVMRYGSTIPEENLAKYLINNQINLDWYIKNYNFAEKGPMLLEEFYTITEGLTPVGISRVAPQAHILGSPSVLKFQYYNPSGLGPVVRGRLLGIYREW
jgi:RHS repeat-associated protein